MEVSTHDDDVDVDDQRKGAEILLGHFLEGSDNDNDDDSNFETKTNIFQNVFPIKTRINRFLECLKEKFKQTIVLEHSTVR